MQYALEAGVAPEKFEGGPSFSKYFRGVM